MEEVKPVKVIKKAKETPVTSRELPDVSDALFKLYSLGKHFSLNYEQQREEKNRKKLEFIYSWINKDDKLLDYEVVSRIHDIEIKIGRPFSGETTLDKIYTYATIDSQINNLMSERDKYINGCI